MGVQASIHHLGTGQDAVPWQPGVHPPMGERRRRKQLLSSYLNTGGATRRSRQRLLQLLGGVGLGFVVGVLWAILLQGWGLGRALGWTTALVVAVVAGLAVASTMGTWVPPWARRE